MRYFPFITFVKVDLDSFLDSFLDIEEMPHKGVIVREIASYFGDDSQLRVMRGFVKHEFILPARIFILLL
jgi:hypothetical protein